MPARGNIPAPNSRLDSWKAIAAFFDRDERTVKRWEKQRGLPVHRLPGREKSGVFAYTAELSEWLESAGGTTGEIPAPNSPPLQPPKKRLGRIAALSCLVLIIAVLAYLLGYRDRERTPVSRNATLVATSQGTPSHPADPEARELYLKGRYYWGKRSPDDLNRAVDYFTQAIVKDPGYAQAYMGLADTYNLLREYSDMPASEAFPRALTAARRAVELDDTSAEAHTSLAFATFYWNWDSVGAEREFKRAIALNPNYEMAHHWYATFLMTVGRLPESAAEIERARDLNPTSTAILADQGLILFYLGQRERAIRQLQQLESAEPNFASSHRYMAMIDYVSRDYSGYLAESLKMAQLMRDSSAQSIAKAGARGFAAHDPRGMLQSILTQQKKLYPRGLASPYFIAQTHAMLGDNPAALQYLDVALAEHEPDLIDVRVDPLFDNLHAEPGYQKLLAKLGLPPLD